MSKSVLIHQQWLRTKSRLIFELTVLLVFALAIWFRAFWPVPMGFPDNGDFPRVLGRINAWPPKGQEGQQFNFLVTDYVIDPGHHWNSHMETLELPLVRLANAVGHLILPPGHFDLRILGAIHAIVLITAVWFLLRTFRRFSWPWSFTLAALTVLVFADVQYLQFLNTAHMDAGAIAFLVLLFSLALTVTGTLPVTHWGWVAAFNVSAALFLSTKLQHQFNVIPLALLCFYLALWTTDRKARIAWLLGSFLVIGTSIWMVRHRTPDSQANPGFSLVFLKLLPLSKFPRESLKELGRPESDLQYIGMHTWSSGSPMANDQYRDRFWHSFSTLRVMKFYRKHPDILGAILWRDLCKSGSDIPVSEIQVGLEQRTFTQYGVFRKSDHSQPNTRPTLFSPWSDVRRLLASRIPLLIPALYLICMAIGTYKILRRPTLTAVKRWPMLLLLGTIGIFSYFAGSLGDATDTARHIVTYQVATDLMILFLLYQIPLRSLPCVPRQDQQYFY